MSEICVDAENRPHESLPSHRAGAFNHNPRKSYEDYGPARSCERMAIQERSGLFTIRASESSQASDGASGCLSALEKP